MLVILTGSQQTGKTRWLERFVREAEKAALTCKGLVSPGTWVRAEDGALEKTGIQAELLPEGTQIPFATRRGLGDGTGASSQADGAKLGWRIYDDAIDQVNAHFDGLAAEGLGSGDVLIVDELGTLELERGGGFTSALALLSSPKPPAEGANAVVVVRPSLVEAAKKRLAKTWGEPLAFDASTDEGYRGMESLIRSFSSASVSS